MPRMLVRLLVITTVFLCGAFAIGADVPSYRDWLKLSGERIDVKSFPAVSSETPRVVKTNVLKRLRWMLGEEPPRASLPRPSLPPASTASRRAIRFGDGLSGVLFLPVNVGERGEKVPLVIMLGSANASSHAALATESIAAFAFDQIGGGSRVEEAKNFYAQHPHWSLLGKRVADTREALDALETIPFIDTNKVWLLGVDSGASTALHVAPLDSRVRGVIALGGFAPMRPCLANRGVPTAAKSQLKYPLNPRLGAFVGNEDRIPYDFRELVEMIAPRPVLLFAPANDTHLDANDLARIYSPMTHVRYQVLDVSNGFDAKVQSAVIAELKRATGLSAP